MINITIKKIKESLILQLELKNADKDFYIDLIDDYCALWKTKEALIKDIKKRGVSYMGTSASGVPMEKENPSVKLLLGTNRQMLMILEKLEISPDKLTSEDDDDL